MTYTKKEILENRQKWIDILKNPSTKKYQEALENPNNSEEKCPLGWACFVLDPSKRVMAKHIPNPVQSKVLYDGSSNILSKYYMDKLAMFSPFGMTAYDTNFTGHSYSSIADLNDQTDITPQELGQMLEDMIMGGENTPFIKIAL